MEIATSLIIIISSIIIAGITSNIIAAIEKARLHRFLIR